ncbi:TetR/AcrR family transcriptional regulator [Saccharothrix yanglingensis]|uniref:TetR family transcriptional regulator n=1 Tax=Saccharothrix yanglingensis TaxID=659496 RepID=A0ABU0WWS4_9PSEU|nr:TetR family transcriptional regulator [Saccharothrix yanglingensis]MDQ2584306.1 TetR family transcriptional regulator [Saccharothrix yanglingensis]
MAPETRQRQADRSRETRRKLMEATVACLVELGWSGTTTTVVAERAGVSRGAQLHHFRTRGELVAAAVEHLGAESVLHLKDRARTVHGSVVAVVELIADFYASDLFTAALELWVAARTDPDLRTVVVPLEARIGRETHRLAVGLLDADEAKPGVREAVQITLDLVRGLALANQLTDDGNRRRRIVRHWARMLEAALEGDGL